ncbi:MAG: type II toxin-antitoxin system RelE/ParE family toxin [Cyanobacteria bacterium]|nr:type II toxin-antitoxin system RelE/ParE family toxin [Cyanobacteriota bacterium]
MAGLPPFSLEKTGSFERTFKKLAKSKAYGNNFLRTISETLKELLNEAYPKKSRDEPLPGSVNVPRDWTLHKLEIKVGKGASGQVRLIYLVNENERVVRPLWIYSHEQFQKRPPAKDLGSVILDAIE